MTALPLTFPAFRVRDRVRDLSLARKIIAVIMGVTSTALPLACLALAVYDTSAARINLTRHWSTR